MGISSIKLIEQQRVKKALLTTYALSLTCFESLILPRLRIAGCESITLLTDIDGYAASLMESRSRFVGRDYALIPVKVDGGGIFHPKIIYLQGDEKDLLLVGSGNITFGGQGRNVEVLDFLDSTIDGAAFGEFANWIEALLASEHVHLSSTADIGQYAKRARTHASAPPVNDAARLLHTFDGTICDQLIEQATALHDDWDELLVLSPFHHRDGVPIRKLASSLGVRSLAIGVPPGGCASSFPFEAAKSWKLKVKAVKPVVEGPTRSLHAKWIEIRGDRTLTLTGSVNATGQALDSTLNIEVGILRQRDHPSRDQWERADIPEYAADRFEGIARSEEGVLYAELRGNEHITGELIGIESAAGEWTASLQTEDLSAVVDEIVVDDDGSFDWKPQRSMDASTDRAIQIMMTRGEQVVRGWLSIPSELSLPARSRDMMRSANRMANRTDTFEDWAVLLDFIAFHTGRLARERTSGTRGSSGAEAPKSSTCTFAVADLFVSDETPASTMWRLAESSGLDENPAAMLHLAIQAVFGRKRLNQPAAARETLTTEPGAEPEDEEATDEDRRILEKRHADTSKAFDSFHNEMADALDRCAPKDAAKILVIWTHIALGMCFQRLNDPKRAYQFIENWLSRAGRCATPVSEREALDEMVYGLAAATALRARTHPDLGTANNAFFRGAKIHHWLERYLQRDVIPEAACASARSWLSVADERLLDNRGIEQAISAFRSELDLPTVRSQVAKIVEEFKNGYTPALLGNVFSSQEEQWLRWAFGAPMGRGRLVIVNHRTDMACTACWHSLGIDIRGRLSTSHVAQCRNCGRTLVSPEP